MVLKIPGLRVWVPGMGILDRPYLTGVSSRTRHVPALSATGSQFCKCEAVFGLTPQPSEAWPEAHSLAGVLPRPH